ncbi:MAG: DUF262 domain-containing protein [Spirochaetia bacterium]|nr:DUF262 domain-containing protein [Spirochaetia bacterium]
MNKQLLEKNKMCNINQYKKLKFTDLLEIYNRIVIPAIQRDYAQGREDKKATEVRKTLLDDIFSDKPEIDFNLVFGSREEYGGKTCFIPVDGQQRLTTLFLLYLYNSKVNGVQTADLNKFTYETRRAAADFCKAIVDNDWENQKDKLSDSIKDCNWFMQYWNQDPTVISMLRMLDDIQKRAPEGNFKEKLDRITFYFYDLKQNGLNETLYIKMNGRGKPLTVFENLKAAIDNILPEKSNYDFKEMGDEASGNTFKEKWQSCIDGKWTDVFWDKEKPYDIDENLTKFIVRFLSGCYTALKPNSDQTADDETKKQLREINDNDNYSSFIPFAPVKKVLEVKESFAFLAHAFSILFSILSCTENVLYPTWRNTDSPFTINEKTEYKTLSVLMAYVLFVDDKKALRFARNMAENTVFGYDDFIRLCRRFGQIKNHSNISDGIYNVLSEIKFDNPSEQLKEEIEKARQILTGNYNGNIADLKGKTWEDVIIEAEKSAFFKGAIRFLFRNEKGEWDWKDFDTKWGNAQTIFCKEGLSDGYKKDALANRILLSYCEDWLGQIESWTSNEKFIFGVSSSVWKNNILLKEIYKRPVHQLLSGCGINDKLSLENKTDENILSFDKLVKTTVISRMQGKQGQDPDLLCVRWANGGFRFFQMNKRKGVILTLSDRDRILNKPEVVLENAERISDNSCPMIYGDWDVLFTYNGVLYKWILTVEKGTKTNPKEIIERYDKDQYSWRQLQPQDQEYRELFPDNPNKS